MLIRLLVLILLIRRNLVLFLPVLLLALKFISTLLTILLAEQLTCLFLQLTVLLCFNSESRVVDLPVWVIRVYCFLGYFLGCSLLLRLQ